MKKNDNEENRKRAENINLSSIIKNNMDKYNDYFY